jgi:hypothetical protein
VGSTYRKEKKRKRRRGAGWLRCCLWAAAVRGLMGCWAKPSRFDPVGPSFFPFLFLFSASCF